MKQLYINNQRCVIGEDIVFPFTRVVHSIEDVTLIGVPGSKTIQLPKCQQNDKIFGWIGEPSRLNTTSDDNQIGSSFNQIRKSTYRLFSESKLVSEGLIRVTGVTQEYYNIELWDKIIDIIEELDGDPITGNGYLSSLPILISGTTFSTALNPTTLKQIADSGGPLKPHLGMGTWSYTGDRIRTTSVTGATATIMTISMPESSTPLDIKSVKTGDWYWALPVSSILESINHKMGSVIEWAQGLTGLFNSLHYNLGRPKPPIINTVNNWDGGQYSTTSGYTPGLTPTLTEARVKLNQSTTNLGKSNGKRTIKTDLSATLWSTGDLPSDFFGGGQRNGVAVEPFTFDAPNGTLLGTIRLGFRLVACGGALDATQYLKSRTSWVDIDLIVGDTCVINSSGGLIYSITINKSIEFSIDWYYSVYEPTTTLTNYLYIDYTMLSYRDSMNYTRFFLNDDPPGYSENQFSFSPTLNNCKLLRNYSEWKTGDTVDGSVLYPKVSIKQWLLTLVKYFNLSIENREGKLYIDKKQWIESGDILPVSEVVETAFSIDYSRLILHSAVSGGDLLSDWETRWGTPYAAQIVNTGYSIRSRNKTQNWDFKTCLLQKARGQWAWDRFDAYGNNGWSRYNYGTYTDSEWGWFQSIPEPIWVVPDTPYEAGLITGTTVPTGIEWTHVNRKLRYLTSTGEWILPTIDTSTGERRLSQYGTLSPYKWDNGTITESLEFSKPVISFADITDAQYPLSSTHWYRIWRGIITDTLSSNTHTIKTKCYLDSGFRPWGIYNYRGTQYIPLRLVEWDPTRPGVYEVEFLKVNNKENYIQ